MAASHDRDPDPIPEWTDEKLISGQLLMYHKLIQAQEIDERQYSRERALLLDWLVSEPEVGWKLFLPGWSMLPILLFLAFFLFMFSGMILGFDSVALRIVLSLALTLGFWIFMIKMFRSDRKKIVRLTREERLAELQKIFDNQLITREEYEALRLKIENRFGASST